MGLLIVVPSPALCSKHTHPLHAQSPMQHSFPSSLTPTAAVGKLLNWAVDRRGEGGLKLVGNPHGVWWAGDWIFSQL